MSGKLWVRKMMSKKLILILSGMLLFSAGAQDQEAVIAPADNLIVDGVPNISSSLAETAGRYGCYPSASLEYWHPTKREMLVATRFAETPQIHLVKTPGGARQQFTFFVDSVASGQFHPIGGDYIVFANDIGGGEWFQLYGYDAATGDVTPLTDGKSRNLVGTVVVERQSNRLHVHAAHGKGHGFVGDESLRPEKRSSAHKAGRRRLGSRGLVAG
jgi:hypothetical protein